MTVAAAPKNPVADWEKVREEWLRRLDALVSDVEQWGQEFGWATRRIEKRLDDSQIGVYQAPALLLQKEFARVLLEPIARFAPGVDGVVDLYLMPAYDDIASLSFRDASWRVHSWPPGAHLSSENHEADAVPLSKEVLQKMLDEMRKNAA